jgi:hypothetical protein
MRRAWEALKKRVVVIAKGRGIKSIRATLNTQRSTLNVEVQS